MSTTSHPYQEFVDFIKAKRWSHLGRDSLAVKLKPVGAHVIDSAMKGGKINRRSKYQLWKVTGLSCFKIDDLSPLEKWFFDHDKSAPDLAKMIKEQTGEDVNVQTLGRTAYEKTTPVKETRELIYRVTKIPEYNPDEDAASATARQLREEQSQESIPLPANANHLDSSDLEGRVNDLERRFSEFERRFNGSTDQPVESREPDKTIVDRVARIFEELVMSLNYFVDCPASERKELIDRVGPEKYGRWVGMLSALSDERQFHAWKQMGDLG